MKKITVCMAAAAICGGSAHGELVGAQATPDPTQTPADEAATVAADPTAAKDLKVDQNQIDFPAESQGRRKVCEWVNQEPDPVVTYTPAQSTPDFPIAPSGEVYRPITGERLALHQQSHHYIPLVNATLPPFFTPPAMNTLGDFVATKKELVVTNPAAKEFLSIMEGKRHGFEELSIVLTNTQTGNGAPLHTHLGEEAHVLLKGTMRYFLNEQEFVVEAPYIVTIPPMVPHAFMNVDAKPAKLVGIFPASNEWDYDVLLGDVFAGDTPPADDRDDQRRNGRYHRRWYDARWGGDGKTAKVGKKDLGKDQWNVASTWHDKKYRDRRYNAFRANGKANPR